MSVREPSNAYAKAGVDISAGSAAVEQYKNITSAWRHAGQLDSIGGFGGLFELPGDASKALVASTDGVGTKVLIAAALGRFDSVGADLVNHCVNDILVVNARPLFFLDYLAVGKLDPEVAASIVRGCFEACRANECALLGGETAEMPGLYAQHDFDLAGTIVGIVDRDAIPDAAKVQPGDAIVGLPSIGLHTNGYSLARTLIGVSEYGEMLNGSTIGDALLAVHPSYAKEVRAIEKVAGIKAMAHITGGGLVENVPRTLPPGVKAVFEQARWKVPPILEMLCERGNLSPEDRYRTFNMGVGYTLVVPLHQAQAALDAVEAAQIVGWIEAQHDGDPRVVVRPTR